LEQDVQKGIPADVRVIQKSSNITSTTAAAKALSLLQLFNREQAAKRLAAQQVDAKLLDALVPVPVDIATSQEKSGFFLGLLLPMFIVLFALIGGMYIAIDVSAGEKERKTLEALLLTPATRLQIVAGKFAAVAITASTTIVLSLASMYAAFKLFPPSFGEETVAIQLSLGAVGIMLGIGVILAVMFSGLLLSVAIFAKNYKEAQNYITPFYLLAVLPVAIFAQIPGFKPTVAFFLIPGVNAVFVIKEVLIGTFNWPHIGLTVGSLLVYALVAIFVSSRIYAKESVLFRS
ncbi:MAG: ABC transporter permease, partial [Patescibacteria group bacterium]